MRWTQKIGRFAVFVDLAHVSCFDFYGLGWALCFACQALYALAFSGWIGFLFRSWMSRRVCPFKQRYRANLYAYAISSADFPINRHVGSMYTKSFRRLNRSPNVMTLMLTSNRSVLFEVRINRQMISPIHS